MLAKILNKKIKKTIKRADIINIIKNYKEEKNDDIIMIID
jgi:hypothetical protein